jgi:hypothetical protein
MCRIDDVTYAIREGAITISSAVHITEHQNFSIRNSIFRYSEEAFMNEVPHLSATMNQDTQDSAKPHCDTAPGGKTTLKDSILENGAAATQNFAPVKAICAHLNAFHVYADDTSRTVEANHYCTHLSADVRQCLIYDAPKNPARLIGVEYMITKRLYEALPEEERKLWHSHEYEVSFESRLFARAPR